MLDVRRQELERLLRAGLSRAPEMRALGGVDAGQADGDLVRGNHQRRSSHCCGGKEVSGAYGFVLQRFSVRDAPPREPAPARESAARGVEEPEAIAVADAGDGAKEGTFVPEGGADGRGAGDAS